MEGAEAWLSNTAAAKKLNIIHTCAVSSRSGTGIQAAAAFIRQQRLGRDVYIVGAANVGKSAFIRCVSRLLYQFLSVLERPSLQYIKWQFRRLQLGQQGYACGTNACWGDAGLSCRT